MAVAEPHAVRAYSPPERPPIELWLALALFALISIAASPDVLIALGPLRESLTSSVDITRVMAERTVLAARLVFAGVAVALAIVIFRWRAISEGRLISTLAAYREPFIQQALVARISRRSMYLALAAVVVSILYIGLIAPGLSPATRIYIGHEDGVVEQMTALMFLVAGVLAFRVAFMSYARPGQRSSTDFRSSVWHLLLGLFFIVCVGEEISWGQRIFGFETTEALREVNVQGEMNLHNSFGYLADHLFILGTLAYGALLPLFAKHYRFWRQLTGWLGLPLATTGLAVGFFVVSGMHDWTVYRILPNTADVRAAEVRELLSAICFVLLMAESWERSRAIMSNRLAGERS